MSELENRLREILERHGIDTAVDVIGIERLMDDLILVFKAAGYMRPANLTEEQAMDKLEEVL